MNYEDLIASDTMRAIAKFLPPDHPSNPLNLARAAAAAAAERAAAPPAPALPQNNAGPLESPQATETPASPVEIVAEPAEPEQPAPPPKKRRKRRNRRRRAPLPPPDESRLERHQRLCTICNSEYREAIEEEFLHWHVPERIAHFYEVDWRAVYRHAHATGLYAARERNLRSALGHMVESVCRVKPTMDGVLRAIRAYSCLDADGHWTELPSHVIVSSGNQLAVQKAIADSAITLNLPAPADGQHPLTVDAQIEDRKKEARQNEDRRTEDQQKNDRTTSGQPALIDNPNRIEIDDPTRVGVPREHRESRDPSSA